MNNNNKKKQKKKEPILFEEEEENKNLKWSERRDLEIAALEERIKKECPTDRGGTSSSASKGEDERLLFRSLPLSKATLLGLNAYSESDDDDDEDETTAAASSKKRKWSSNQRSSKNKPKKAGKKSYKRMTAIQAACIPHALTGRDILGAARTGSGKTLAFLIPTLERLYRQRWSSSLVDGTGAIILSPTRELAIQIFQVLRSIGSHHTFSAGLIVGRGSSSNNSSSQSEFAVEQSRISQMNILVATPGRLLQHLEQTPSFDVSNLSVLVLDEADRILDMGFRDQLLRILEYIPKPDINTNNTNTTAAAQEGRQTMLFSATQTRKVSDLATLSLHQPEYIGVHDHQNLSSTPQQLQQHYIIVPLSHKLNALYSFLKSHLQSKIICFFASCSQVRHAWELFCSLRPGISLLALHGKIHQQHRRTQIYYDYIQRANGCCLFATDIAARGLDFPNVDWVVQVDAPESVDMYIHRVGRTARYRSGGRSLLMLMPIELMTNTTTTDTAAVAKDADEEDATTTQQQPKQLQDNDKDNVAGGMIAALHRARVSPITKLSINPSKTILISKSTSSIVASNPSLQSLAKKAFKSYLRSLYYLPSSSPCKHSISSALQLKNKDKKEDLLSLEEYAWSLGLASIPSLQFLKSLTNHDRGDEEEGGGCRKKNVNYKLMKLKEQIRLERLQKRLSKTTTTTSNKTKTQEEVKNEKTKENQIETKMKEDDNDEDELLIAKKKHDWSHHNHHPISSTITTTANNDNNHSHSSHNLLSKNKNKRIRLNGSTLGINQRIVFSDDDNNNKNKDKDEEDDDDLIVGNELYIQSIRQRLLQTQDLDKRDEKIRLREKKRKNKSKQQTHEEDEDDDVMMGAKSITDDDDHSDSDDNDNHGDDGHSESDSDSGEDHGDESGEDDDESEQKKNNNNSNDNDSNESDDNDHHESDDNDNDNDDDLVDKEKQALAMLGIKS